jgi:osmotically-inducible protein OsmY
MRHKTDDELKREVMFQLGWDLRIKETGIGVIVKDGVVTLIGSVESYAEKLAAQDVAHRARGVLDVANELIVRSSTPAQPSDADIARKVRDTLDWDVFVPKEQIHTSVADGWVTLSGMVESLNQRLQAERAITHLHGVRGVTNKLLVATTINSHQVKGVVEKVLEIRADREAERIGVKVDGGEVTLTGGVSSWDEKRSILGAIRHLPGVTEVRDHLFIDVNDMRFESAGW